MESGRMIPIHLVCRRSLAADSVMASILPAWRATPVAIEIYQVRINNGTKERTRTDALSSDETTSKWSVRRGLFDVIDHQASNRGFG
jgi:hypothetical protein